MVKRASNPENPPGAPTFERAMAELEEIVRKMEGGELSLEESLEAYRKGAELVAHSRQLLADAQQQVRILEDQVLKPFDSAAADER